MIDEIFKEMDKDTSVTHLHLYDEVIIHNVNLIDEVTIEDIWNSLEQLYISKKLSNKLYMELYGLCIIENLDLLQHLNTFNKFTSQLLQFKVLFEEKDKTILFLVQKVKNMCIDKEDSHRFTPWICVYSKWFLLPFGLRVFPLIESSKMLLCDDSRVVT